MLVIGRSFYERVKDKKSRGRREWVREVGRGSFSFFFFFNSILACRIYLWRG